MVPISMLLFLWEIDKLCVIAKEISHRTAWPSVTLISTSCIFSQAGKDLHQTQLCTVTPASSIFQFLPINTILVMPDFQSVILSWSLIEACDIILQNGAVPNF